MSSFHGMRLETHPSAVWRDALGPGYAVGVAEGVLRVAGAAAKRPYRAGR